MKHHSVRIETLIIAIGIAVAATIGVSAWYFSRIFDAQLVRLRDTDPGHREREWLRHKYGPDRHSQFEEEWIIRDFFGDRKGGTFVDVGAADARTWSNTYYLERVLGWSGLAIDPQVQFSEGYRTHRPRTRFVPLFVSDRSDDHATLYVTESPWVSSSEKAFTERWGQVGQQEVPTITLDDLLEQQGIGTFDFLSMDIELHEPRALAGFSIKRFSPSLVCIEAHPEVRQSILTYFARAGYVPVAKYLRVDRHNLYFAPVDVARDLPLFPREVTAVSEH